MDIINDLVYLAVAAVFFAASFGLIAGFDRMIGIGNNNNKERKP